MEEDIFPAAERILLDIENIFKKYFNLISFEIIQSEGNDNKSPVCHNGNALGLASWCIQPLYCYVYNRLFLLKRNESRREEPAVILRWLLGALLLNPEVSSFWNMRREFIKSGRLDPTEELRLVNVILYHKVKCFETYSYRRWILNYILIKNGRYTHETDILLRNEIQVVSIAADRYKNNCYAWDHRESMISLIELLYTDSYSQVLEHEWEESTRWHYCHVSDYSGLSYRQTLIKRLLIQKYDGKNPSLSSKIWMERWKIILEFVSSVTRGRNDIFLLSNGSHEEILDLLHGVHPKTYCEVTFQQTLINLSYWVEDCMINDALIKIFPSHETLWYYRRFLVWSLLALNNSYERFSFYKAEIIDPTRKAQISMIKSNNKVTEVVTEKNMTDSLLVIAFCFQNKKLTDVSSQMDSHNMKLIKKFRDFLIHMRLEL